MLRLRLEQTLLPPDPYADKVHGTWCDVGYSGWRIANNKMIAPTIAERVEPNRTPTFT